MSASTGAKTPPPPPPRLEQHLVVETVGRLTTVITSRPVTLAQGLDGDDVVTMPTKNDFLLLADTVTVHGTCTANGQTVTIIAREIATEGTDAAIVVDGAAGVNGNQGKTDAELKPDLAGVGVPGWPDNPGGPGNPGTPGNTGASGTAGGRGGTISIYARDAATGLNLKLSARGGNGGNGQNGQNGGDGGPGGPGYTTQDGNRGTAGGQGGPGGKGGNGGAAGAPGQGGTIVWNVVTNSAPSPICDVTGGRAGNPGKAGAKGNPGHGGPGGSGHVRLGGEGGGEPVPQTEAGGQDGSNDGVPDAHDGAFAEIGLSTVTGGAVVGSTSGTTVQVASASGYPQVPFDAFLAPAILLPSGPYGPLSMPDLAGAERVRAIAFDEKGMTFTVVRAQQASTALAAATGWFFVTNLDGTVESKSGCDYSFVKLVEPAALLSYLRMEYDRAQFVYLSIDPASIDPKQIWAEGATAADVAPSFRETLGRTEWARAIVDAATAGMDLKAVQPFESIWASLDAMHKSFHPGGLDYFGHRPNWVPKVRFEYYLAALDGPHGNDGAIAQLADAETRAADYQAQALKDLQEQSYLDAVASDAGDVQATCKTAMKDTLQVISDLSAKIEEEDDAVTAARKVLNAKLQDAKKGFEEGESPFGGLTWEKVFDAITQVAFLPENPFETGLNTLKSISLLGPQVGKLGGALGDASQVTDDDGQPLPTAWVINNIKAIGDSVDQLAEGFSTASDGTLSADDPNLTMLLASKSALDQLLQKSYDSPDADQLHQASSNMDDYLAAVSARNGTILQYNAELAQYRQTWAQAKAATAAEANALDLKTAATTLGLADAGNLIDAYLGQARLSCIEALYMTSRAWSRWALQPEDRFYHDLQLDNAWDFNSTLAKQVRAALITSEDEAIEKGWPANPEPPPPATGNDEMDQKGLVWTLRPSDWPNLFRGLRDPTKGAGFVTLPPARHLLPAGPFANMLNIRLRGVRCWLHGVKSSTNLVWVRLTHCGDETFVVNAQPDPEDPMKNDVQLRHDPIAIDFRYLAKNDADVGDWRSVVGHANTIDGDLTDPTGVYAAIGPSATWKIELLDLVTALRGTRPQVPAAQLVAVTGTVTTFDGLTIKITPDAGTAVTFDVTKGDIDLTGIETGSKVEAEGVKDVAGKAHPALKWLKDRSNTIIDPTGLSAIDFEFFIYYDSDTHIK